MWAYFDNLGKLIWSEPYGTIARVGTTRFKIFAYFEGVNLEYYNTATIRFQKPDYMHSEYPTMFMSAAVKTYQASAPNPDLNQTLDPFQNTQQYAGFEFDFAFFPGDEDTLVLLDTPGLWKATITLVGSSRERDVTGILTFNVEEAVLFYDTQEGSEVDPEDLVESVEERVAGALQNADLDYLRSCRSFVINAINGTLDKSIFVPNAFIYDGTVPAVYKIISVTENEQDPTKVFATYELVDAGEFGGSETRTYEVESTKTITEMLQEVENPENPFFLKTYDEQGTEYMFLCFENVVTVFTQHLYFLDIRYTKTYSVSNSHFGETIDDILISKISTTNINSTNEILANSSKLLTSDGAFKLLDGTYTVKKAEQTPLTLNRFSDVSVEVVDQDTMGEFAFSYPNDVPAYLVLEVHMAVDTDTWVTIDLPLGIYYPEDYSSTFDIGTFFKAEIGGWSRNLQQQVPNYKFIVNLYRDQRDYVLKGVVNIKGPNDADYTQFDSDAGEEPSEHNASAKIYYKFLS